MDDPFTHYSRIILGMYNRHRIHGIPPALRLLKPWTYYARSIDEDMCEYIPEYKKARLIADISLFRQQEAFENSMSNGEP